MTSEEIKELAELIATKMLATAKKVLSFDDVCVITGLSKSHLYKLTSAKQIPFYKPKGKLVYFDREEIEKWMLTNRVTTTAEIETMANHYLEKGETK